METNNKEKSQADKFREAARQLETDDDEAQFNENMKKLAEAGAKAGKDVDKT